MTDGVGLLKRLDNFTRFDLEAVALILRGASVIDWHRLHISTIEEAHEVIAAQELSPDDPRDRERMEHLKGEAISYLRRHFEFPIPKPIEQASPEDLLLVASTKGHRQVCACSVLKAMHIIHHLDGRELLFTLPLSDQEVFHLVEEKVYRVIGGMLSAGFPITEFVGGRKNKDSLYTKLLSKQDTIAAAIYDKLRFRIVTRTQEDILPVLLYLSHRLFPFNYVIPAESVNTIFHFKSYCEKVPHLAAMIGDMQTALGDDLNPGDNRFSADNYRTIHFVVDLPVRLPRETLELAPSHARTLGSIVYVLCEFQLIDQDTEAANELGEASHARYKERQKSAVMRRLKIGSRELYTPPGATTQKKAADE
ncbi:MAG TPA: TIGR04552 family protein [Polyangiaceae bacterium]